MVVSTLLTAWRLYRQTSASLGSSGGARRLCSQLLVVHGFSAPFRATFLDFNVVLNKGRRAHLFSEFWASEEWLRITQERVRGPRIRCKCVFMLESTSFLTTVRSCRQDMNSTVLLSGGPFEARRINSASVYSYTSKYVQ